MRIKLLVAAAGLFAVSTGAQAAFFDNFDGYAGQGVNPYPNSYLNWTGGGGWTITSGTVDLVANGDFSLTCFGNGGKCIDLDGSTKQSGLLFNGASLTANTTYVLSFEMSGNQRQTQIDNVTVKFGTSTAVFAVPGSAGVSTFNVYTLAYTPSSTQSATISFQDDSTNNIGAILDNVSVDAVPLPASGWLLLSAVGALGVFGRKRAARDAPA
jgi:hypothetical protein